MPRTYKIGEIARRLAYSGTPESTLANRLRNFAQHNLIVPESRQGQGRTAHALYALEEVAKAAVLAALVDILEVDTRTLMTVVDAMARPSIEGAPSTKREGAWVSRGGLRDALKGIAAGESWSLRLRMWREAGEKKVRAWFAYDGDVELPSDHLTVTLPLASILSPLVIES